MRVLFAIVLLVLTVGAVLAQESPHEEVINETLKLLDRIHGILKDIPDPKAPEDARTELRQAAEAWRDVRKKEKDLPPPERAEKDRLANKYKTETRKKVAMLLGQVRRVEGIPGGRQALAEISGVLKKPDE